MNVSVDNNEEKLLVARLREGDHLAFRAIYENYADALLRRLLRLTRVDHIAEDLLQETFVKLWEKRETIDPGLPLKPWLYKVAENLVFQFFRKLALDSRLQNEMIEWYGKVNRIAFEEELFSREKQDLLHQAIRQLSPQQRQVFNLCKLEGLSYEETASLLGISPSTVSNHLVKASASVRHYLRQHKDSIFSLLSLFL
ncbi:RNA polymerase sigma factor [Larkinella terrae]|uniref:Sigma-70 family RNA polymerase sigma factor n=1 Tax=Larkinella terrae TaxID=2025311 RepID=A0A7K0ETZ0_9BACT|nr:sigma-70 family RNA polymerase sigma factor [Larkinella terrae]MRS65274.1 sigma-70 family RNA polymerase sigma factor [Larkinella terrae]